LFGLLDRLLPLQPLLGHFLGFGAFLQEPTMPLFEAMSIANQTFLELSKGRNHHRGIAAISCKYKATV
jgi:hypothetical protein